MNCKQGDLAIVVRSSAGNEGKIVTCLRLATIEEIEQTNLRKDMYPYWAIDQALPTRTYITNRPAGNFSFVPDCVLKPLRDNEGEDETFQWAGKPCDANVT